MLPLREGVTLGEGATPVIPARSFAGPNGASPLLLKLETRNPTGSFKDRGSALVVTAARALGRERLAIASTGNAAASTAAYAARAGLSLTIVVPEWCETGKLWNTSCYGGEIRKVAGDFSAAERAYAELAASGWFPAGSDNPYRTEGTKTVAYELFEQLGDGFDRVIAPIGTGGLFVSLQKGFRELVRAGALARLPALDGVQLAGVPPLDADASAAYASRAAPSVATGINIPRPMFARESWRILEASGGMRITVGDDEILAAQRLLACREGVTAEPTGAVCVAAYRRAVERGLISPRQRVVALVTGSLKSADQLVPSCGDHGAPGGED
jgi:threonine synthase